jgi:hypothetical protein
LKRRYRWRGKEEVAENRREGARLPVACLIQDQGKGKKGYCMVMKGERERERGERARGESEGRERGERARGESEGRERGERAREKGRGKEGKYAT